MHLYILLLYLLYLLGTVSWKSVLYNFVNTFAPEKWRGLISSPPLAGQRRVDRHVGGDGLDGPIYRRSRSRARAAARHHIHGAHDALVLRGAAAEDVEDNQRAAPTK
jgi:hypothetical protein